jgi:hypothetical protein
MPYTPMTLEELKAKQKIVDNKLANTPPSHLHRIRGQWIKTRSHKPWFSPKVEDSSGDKCTQ